MSQSRKSTIWLYFEKQNNDFAKCIRCNKQIKCKGSSTSSLRSHLKAIHGINDQQHTDEDDAQPSTSKKFKFETSTSAPIVKFLQKESLGELLAKCAAYDGFSINAIIRSTAIREFITKRGYEMPRTRHTVKKLILEFYKEKVNELKIHLKTLKEKGEKFSITVDEWTDIKMKRYINVTLHLFNKSSYKLGLIKILNTCDASKTKELVAEKLSEFGLDFDRDIIASTHDGAAVMIKYGKLILGENQLCYNHGIHLAVADVFYKDKDTDNEDDDFSEYEVPSESESEQSNTDDEDESIEHGCQLIEKQKSSNVMIPKRNIKIELENVRKLVRFFKYSSVKNAILQQHVKNEFKSELNLLLDCKTRWNSIIPMVDRILKLRKAILKAATDLAAEHLYNNINFEFLENISSVLKPIELTVLELSKESATLLSAEGAIKFLFAKMNEMDSFLSKKMLSALKVRINERRNKSLVTLLLYLHNSHVPKSDSNLDYSTKKEAINLAKNLFERFFKKNCVNDNNREEENLDDIEKLSDDDDDEPNNGNLTIQLAKYISIEHNKSKLNDSQDQDINKLFRMLEANNSKHKILDDIYKSLLSIQPTSTSSERTFSVAALFSTKIRNKIKYDLLTSLIFLKYFFSQKNKK